MQMKELKEALETSNPIIKDECGDPNIVGKYGHVYVDGDGSFGPFFYVMAEGKNLSKRLDFMEEHQNSCVWKLHRLPTSEEANVIRKVVGLTKKRQYTPENKEILTERIQKFQFQTRTSSAVS
jgi:hypothetical protein